MLPKSLIDELKAKGWVTLPNGDLAAPSRVVGGLGAGVGVEPPGPLVGSSQAEQSGPGGIRRGGETGQGSRRSKQARRQVDAYKGEARGPIVTVCFVCIRHKRIDDDNLSSGCKSLRDAVAQWLGIDDGDPRVAWEYRQHVGKPTGTIVVIS